MVVTDPVTGMSRPSSGAFEPDDDGLSVYRHDVLEQEGCAVADVVSDAAVPAWLSVAEVRAVAALGVIGDPHDEPDPCGRAHALVRGWTALSRKQRRAAQRQLATSARWA
jgi:hypothetical protein